MKKLLFLLTLLAALMLSGCGANKNPYADVPNPVATITMTDGSVMRADLYLDQAPNTVANFVELANAGFYDGMHFFRIVPGVLIQTGDPAGDGSGNAGYTIHGEFSANGYKKNLLSHTRGTLSMCLTKDEPNSGSSQFFILQGSYPEYDGNYAAFGHLTNESLATLDAIASTPVDGDYRPVGSTPTIQSIRVETGGFQYEAAKIDLPKED